MSYTTSPNMNLSIPGVGTEAGPMFAFDINNSLTLVDSHDHTPGKGVQITPAGMNINTLLPMNNNFLTSTAGVSLQAQSGTPSTLGTLYESGVDLYFVDGLGNNIRFTQSGGIAGSPGSISGLTSPASAAYVSASNTFVWQSNTSVAANLDAASILLRNITPNSTYALTLSPPASLASNYGITLPTLPGSIQPMLLDNSGNITSALLTTSNLSATAGIVTGQIAANTILEANISPGTITANSISSSAAILGSQLNTNANIVGTQLAAQSLATRNYALGSVTTPILASLNAAPSATNSLTYSSGALGSVGSLGATITSTSGRPINISFQSGPSAGTTDSYIQLNGTGTAAISARFAIFKGGTQISTWVLSTYPGGTVTLPTLVINPGDTASHAYSLSAQVLGTTTGIVFSNIEMLVYEMG